MYLPRIGQSRSTPHASHTLTNHVPASVFHYFTPTQTSSIRTAFLTSITTCRSRRPSLHLSHSPPPSTTTFHASWMPLVPQFTPPTSHRRTRAEIFFFSIFFLFLQDSIRRSRIHDSAYLTTSRTLNSSLITIPAPPQLHPHPETTPKPPRSVGDVGTDSDNGYHARRTLFTF